MLSETTTVEEVLFTMFHRRPLWDPSHD